MMMRILTIPKATVETKQRRSEACWLNCPWRKCFVSSERVAWYMLTMLLRWAGLDSRLYTLTHSNLVLQNTSVFGKWLGLSQECKLETMLPRSCCITKCRNTYNTSELLVGIQTLTLSERFLVEHWNMFGLSNGSLITTGCLSSRVVMISVSISGGAEAVRATKGADLRARSPPRLWNARRKLSPLVFGQDNYKHLHYRITATTINPPLRNAMCFIYSNHSNGCQILQKLSQGFAVIASGDINTEVRQVFLLMWLEYR